MWDLMQHGWALLWAQNGWSMLWWPPIVIAFVGMCLSFHRKRPDGLVVPLESASEDIDMAEVQKLAEEVELEEQKRAVAWAEAFLRSERQKR